jgi:hypothetical protein
VWGKTVGAGLCAALAANFWSPAGTAIMTVVSLQTVMCE